MSWMLDTNAVSDLLKGDPGLARQLRTVRPGALYLSAVTVAELEYGLAKRPRKRALHEAVRELLLRVQIAPWTAVTAAVYGPLRARLEAQGTPLGTLDTLIAAQALELECTLVSHDRAFHHVPELKITDWHA